MSPVASQQKFAPRPEVTKRVITVDVVIPCYNYARYLNRCVESVLSQAGVDVRILVIDDASPDNTPEIGKLLAASDHRIEFRRHKDNQGHIATYNEGLIDWSTADYVALLSADDMLAPGSLSRATQIMEDDGDIGMVYGRTIHFVDEKELPKIREVKWRHTKFAGAEWVEGRCRAGYNVITSPEVVVRGSIQRTVGGYRKELPHAGDLEMWLRIAAVADVAYVHQVPQAFYRVHPKSMMRTVYRGSFFDLQQRRDAFEAFFRHCREYLDESERLQWLAKRTLAREALWDACRSYDRNQVEESRADALIEFALETCADAQSLPEYAALLRRQRLGPVFCKRTQLFAAPALMRKIRRLILKERWKRRGV